MKIPEPLVYYSANTYLAYWLNKTFYNNKHFVWCSPAFDPGKLDTKDIRCKIPPSSSPFNIYCSLSADLKSSDMHSSKIKENKYGLIRGANYHLEIGTIDEEEYARIIRIIDKATIAEFRPLIYVIPSHLIKDRLKEVEVDLIANPLSIEYQINDLTSEEFDLIEFI